MKHNTSSLFKLLLTLVLIVAALLPQRAEAASSSLSGDSTVQAGSTVTLTLSISGSNVMGIEATLEYDSNTLEFTNYDQKISGWTMDYNSNHFLLYGVSNPINSSTGVLTVTFRVKSGLASGTALTAGFKNIVVSDGSKDETVSGTSWTGSVATPPSSNCDLSSLTCSNATLSPAFNKSTTNYTATVPYAVESLNLSYKAADGSARVSVSGNTLVVGSNTVTVTCTAATGAKKNYTITVTREQDPNYKPSTDALLKELTLDVGTLSPTFSGAVTEYVAYVPYENPVGDAFRRGKGRKGPEGHRGHHAAVSGGGQCDDRHLHSRGRHHLQDLYRPCVPHAQVRGHHPHHDDRRSQHAARAAYLFHPHDGNAAVGG